MATLNQKHQAAVVARHGNQCYFCGCIPDKLTLDHFVPVYEGGTSHIENLVPACGVCNSIKGERTVEEVRFRLVLKMLGWPKLSLEQLDWLRSRGFEMSEYDNAKLWFERRTDSE